MIHMLCRFDLKPGNDEARFARVYSNFIALLRAEDLIVKGDAMGRREADTPMDTDKAEMRKYYAVLSFRDREQLDASYSRFLSSMSGHEAVLAGICNSVFTCWRDIDEAP